MSSPGDLPDLISNDGRVYFVHYGSNANGNETYHGLTKVDADRPGRLDEIRERAQRNNPDGGRSTQNDRAQWERTYAPLHVVPGTGHAAQEPLPHPDLRGTDGRYYAFVGMLNRDGERLPGYERGERNPTEDWIKAQHKLARDRLRRDDARRSTTVNAHTTAYWQTHTDDDLEFSAVPGTGPDADKVVAEAEVPEGERPEIIEAGVEVDAMTDDHGHIYLHTGGDVMHIGYLYYKRTSTWTTIRDLITRVERARQGQRGRYDGGVGENLEYLDHLHRGSIRRLTADDLPKDLIDGADRVWLHVGDHEGPRYRLAGPAIGPESARFDVEVRRQELIKSLPEPFNVARCYSRKRIEDERGIKTELPREFGPFEPVPEDPIEAAEKAIARQLRKIDAYRDKVRARAVRAYKDGNFRDERRLERSLGRLHLDGLKRKREVPVTIKLAVEDTGADVEAIVAQIVAAMHGGELPEGMVRQHVNVDRSGINTTVV